MSTEACGPIVAFGLNDTEPELELCDEQVRDIISRISRNGGVLMIGTATQMQLVKELRLLREALEKQGTS